jgi:hypothetical protein
MRVGGAPAVLASSSRRPRWIVEREIPVARITTAIPPLTERARLGRRPIPTRPLRQYRRQRRNDTGIGKINVASRRYRADAPIIAGFPASALGGSRPRKRRAERAKP